MKRGRKSGLTQGSSGSRRPFRWTWPAVARLFGVGVAWLGGGAIAVGAALPWATFPLFGATVSLPGVAGIGAIALVFGALGTMQAHRRPIIAALCGLLAFGVATYGKRTIGRDVVKRMLQVESRLSPVNEQLARVGVPPLVVFPSIRPSASYLGPGVAWALWGSALLTVGATGALSAGLWARSCGACGALWPAWRAPDICHCPRCGARARFSPDTCQRCFGTLERPDKFCIRCGHGR